MDLLQISNSTGISNPINNLVTNRYGWEVVNENWPSFNDKKINFFFNDDIDNEEPNYIDIKFSNSFIEQMKKLDLDIDISFEIWIRSKENSDSPILNLSGASDKSIDLYKRYKNQTLDWMTYQMQLNSKEMGKFKIYFVSSELFVSIRKFQVDYKIIEKRNVTNTTEDKLFLDLAKYKNYFKLCFPSKASFDIDHSKSDLIYFPQCANQNFCQIDLKPKRSANKITLKIWASDVKRVSIILEDKPLSQLKNETDPEGWMSITIPTDKSKSLKFEFNLISPIECKSLMLKVDANELVKFSSENNLKKFEYIRKQPNNFYFSREISKIVLDTSSIKSIDQVCIKFEIQSVNENSSLNGYIDFYYNLGQFGEYTQYQQKLTTISFDSINSMFNSDLCLKSYVNFEAQNYSILLQLNNEGTSPVVFNFKTISAKVKDQIKVAEFLLPFAVPRNENVIQSLEELTIVRADKLWHSQWNEDFENFGNFFVFKPNSIVFRNMDKFPIVYLSTNWIRYITTFEIIYQIKFKRATGKKMKIYPLVCDQLGECFKVTANQQMGTNMYHFELPSLHTKLYRLVFAFEQHKFGSMLAELSILNTNHPCYVFNQSTFIVSKRMPETCHNNGLCFASQSEENNFQKCECANGFSGQFCDIVDHCIIPKVDTGKSGYEYCKSKGLDCQKMDDDYVCICKGPQIFWDVEKQECQNRVSSQSYPMQMGKEPIVYDFDKSDIRPRGFDICFQLKYNATYNGTEQFKSPYTDYPAILANFNNEHNLFKHLLTLNSSEESYFKFCLQDFLPEAFIQSQSTFSISFHVNNVSNLKLIINEVIQSMEAMEYSIDQMMHSISTYNEYFLNVLQYSKWKIGLDGENQKTEFIRKENELKIFENNKASKLVTMISPWLRSYSSMNSLIIPWLDSTNCKLQYLSVKIIYLNKNNETEILSLNPKKDDSKLHYEIDLKEFTSVPTYFKVIIELINNCNEIVLKPIQINQMNCTNDCGNGSCKPNYRDGSFQCQCTEQYFGESCKQKNPCANNPCSQFPTNRYQRQEPECTPLSETDYSCKCWPGLFQWNSLNKCVSLFQKTPIVEPLDEGNYAYLNGLVTFNDETTTKTGVMKWMDRSMYWSSASIFNGSEYFMALKPETSSMLFSIPALNKDQDYCLTLSYLTYSGGQIGFSFNSNTNVFWTSLVSKSQPHIQICMRSFVDFKFINQELKDSTLKISSSYSSKDVNNTQFVAIRFEPNDSRITKFGSLSPNDYYESKKNSMKTLFSFQLPLNFWEITDTTLSFKHEIISTESTSNQELASGTKVSYILSNWFSNEDSNLWSNHILQFTLSSQQETENITLIPIIFNSKMEEIGSLTIDSYKNNYANIGDHLISVSSKKIDDKFYRFGFKITIEESQLKNVNLQLTNIELDNFCLLNSNNNRTLCHNGGFCVVNPKIPKLGYECNCTRGYEGSDCSNVNACELVNKNGEDGNQICAKSNSGKCIRTHDDFYCDCNGDSSFIWDKDFKKCKHVSPCIEHDPCNPKTGYCYNDQEKARCRCKYGYVHQNKDDLDSPCVVNDNPCKDACGRNADCSILFGTFKPFCYCKNGYVKDKSDTKKYSCKKPNLCESKFNNPCEQECKSVNTADGYECECFSGYQMNKNKHCVPVTEQLSCKPMCDAIDSYCEVNTNVCKCRDGFEYKSNYTDDGLDACVPKQDQTFDECPGGKSIYVEKLKRFTCNCSSNLYEWDTNLLTCKIKKICGENGEGFKECAKRNSLCILNNESDITKSDLYHCDCKPEQHWNKDSNDPDAKCIDRCQDKKIIDFCNTKNAICDPLSSFNILNEFNETNVKGEDICRCKEGMVSQNSTYFRCTFPQIVDNITDNRKIYTFNLQILKKSYENLEDFQDFINEINKNFDEKTDPLMLLQTLEKEMPSRNFREFMDHYEKLSKNISNLIYEQLNKIETIKGQLIINQLLELFVKEYIKSNNEELKIQAVNCNPYTDNNEKNYLDCQFETILTNLTSLSDFKDDRESFEIYLERKFKGYCRDTVNEDCIILINNSSESSSYYKLDETKALPKTSSLILFKKTLNEMNVQQFKYCADYKDQCPKLTKCIEKEPSFMCNCEYAENNSIFYVNSSELSLNGVLVTPCHQHEESYICHKYGGDQSLYELNSCNFTLNYNKNGNPIVDLFFNCTENGILQELKENPEIRDEFVHIHSKCVEKEDLCKDYECKNNGTCVVEDMKPHCNCLKGWTGDHCEKKVTDKDKDDEDDKKDKWLLIIKFRKYCCKKKRNSVERNYHREETNPYRVDRERSTNIEMSQMQTNGTYRRNESFSLSDNLPPKFQIVPTDRRDEHNERSHRMEREMRQTEVHQSVSIPHVKQVQTTNTVAKKKVRTKKVHDTPKADYSSDSSSNSNSSIELPPSRPPPPPSSSSSDSNKSGDNGPIILTRAMLLNSPTTSSVKQISTDTTNQQEYVPSALRNRTDDMVHKSSKRTSIKTEEKRTSNLIMNPAIVAMKNATNEIGNQRRKHHHHHHQHHHQT
ncbi:hypothetical protein RDWZM_002998 [Blomia tropicalis]|uniref:EGF-like domain-containing protein n=1 Tax=Blomia tropicalis TaxID=40697 RepID=A0A9Q0RQF1_BLOTA|nr:hypothetical protein RDWZM_002998 [Blomia tropicalis]